MSKFWVQDRWATVGPVALLVALLVGLLAYFFPLLWAAPNDWWLAHDGDGVLTYYFMAFHALFPDAGWVFEGFQYPYGVFLPMTDSQPLLLWLFHAGVQQGWWAAYHSAAFLHTGLLLGFVLAGLSLFGVFRRLGMGHAWAVWGAVVLLLMSAQWPRIGGHLTLSYMLPIPLAVFCWLSGLFASNLRWRLIWASLLALQVVFWAFVMPYHAVLIGIWVMGASGFAFLWQWVHSRRHGNTSPGFQWAQWPLFASLAVTVTLVGWAIWNTSFNPHPPYIAPFNAVPTLYAGNLRSLVQPTYGPINQLPFLKSWLAKSPTWESWAYLGLAVLLVLVGWVVSWGVRLFLGRDARLMPHAVPLPLAALGFAGLVGMLLGLGIPLAWIPPDIVFEFSALSQIRALGRLFWLAYYSFGILGIYLLWKLWQYGWSPPTGRLSRSLRWVAWGLVVLYSVESFGYMVHFSGQKTYTPNYLDPKIAATHPNLPAILAALPPNPASQYQALLPLPNYLANSTLGPGLPDSEVITLSILASVHTRLPLMAGYASRTAYAHTQSLLHIASPLYADKRQLLEALDSERPILVLADTANLPTTQADLLALCKPLGRSGPYLLAELKVANWIAASSSQTWHAAFRESQAELVPCPGGFCLPQFADQVLYQPFDTVFGDASRAYRGGGAFHHAHNEFRFFWHEANEPMQVPRDTPLRVSFWLRSTAREPFVFPVQYRVVYADGSADEPFLKMERGHAQDAGDWWLFESDLRLPPGTQTWSMFVTEKNYFLRDSAWIDELMIRPAAANVWNPLPNKLYLNNYPLPPLASPAQPTTTN